MGKLCECGSGLRKRGAWVSTLGCDRCNAIDGWSARQRDVVHELRLSDGPLTTHQLAECMGVTVNSIYLTLRRMQRKGLVRIRLVEQVGSDLPVGVWSLAVQAEGVAA